MRRKKAEKRNDISKAHFQLTFKKNTQEDSLKKYFLQFGGQPLL
jgi:hypothetical protein